MKNDFNFRYIDTEYLYSVSSNNDFIKRIFSLFREEVKVFEKTLPFLEKEKKYGDLADLVHKAKSSTAILGMRKQSEKMKNLETDIRNSANQESFKERISEFLYDCNEALKEVSILEKKI